MTPDFNQLGARLRTEHQRMKRLLVDLIGTAIAAVVLASVVVTGVNKR